MKLNNVQTNNKKYFYEISFIRAIACLCIVMVHVTAGFYYENGKTFSWLTQFFNQISRYGTPAFAIISGFLLYNQAIKGNFNLNKFIKSRFTKIAIPFFIWSFIYLALKWHFNQTIPSINSEGGIKEFLYYFFTGKSYYHLYFIAIVVQFYLLFPVLQLLKSKKSLIFMTLISFFVNYFIVNFKIEIGSGIFNSFINDKVFLFHWIFYFLFGGLLSHYWAELMSWVKQNVIYCIMLGIIVIIGGILEYHFTGWIESNRAINMFNLPVLFIAMSGVYYSLSSWNKVRDIIIEIGNLSMGIYLIHPLILFFLRRYEVFDPFYAHSRYLPLVFTFTMLLSIILVKLLTHLPFGRYIVTVAKTNGKKVKTEESITSNHGESA